MTSGNSSLREPTLRYHADFHEFRLLIERRSDGWYLLGSERAKNRPLFYSACLSLEAAKQRLVDWVARQSGEQPAELEWHEEYS